MSNIEEDYNLFQLVKTTPINSCIDLSKNMIGKKRGVFYFTERFRIDFENKMSDFERLKAEREQDKKRIKELEEENLHWRGQYLIALDGKGMVPKQKVIDRINYCDERIKHAKQIRDKEQEEFYTDLKRAFNKLLEEK